MKRSKLSLEEKVETPATTPPSAVSRSTRAEFYSKWQKRRKTQSASLNPFTVLNVWEGLDISKFGSAAKEIEQLRARRRRIMHSCFGFGGSPADPAPSTGAGIKKDQSKNHKHALNEQADLDNGFIDLVDDQVTSKPYPIVTLDFDDEENEDLRLSCSDKGDKDQLEAPSEQFTSLSDQASNYVAEKVSPIIILDSDDEDNEDFKPSSDEGVQNPSNVVTDQVVVIEKTPSIELLDPKAGKYGEFSPDADDDDEGSRTLVIVNDHVLKKASSTAILDPCAEKYGEFSPATAADEGSGTLERVNEHIIEKASSAATLDPDAEKYGEFRPSAADGGSGTLEIVNEQLSHVLDNVVTGSMDEHITKTVTYMSSPPTTFYSDGKRVQQFSSLPNQVVDMTKPTGELSKGNILVKDCIKDKSPSEEVGEVHLEKDKGVYIGVEDDMEVEERYRQNDGLDDIWKEMSFALECSKDAAEDLSSEEHIRVVAEDCDHCFILKDDLGYVCRVCGVIQRGIETIFEFVYFKGKKSTRTYMSESQSLKHKESNENFSVGDKFSEDVKMVSEINADPRHMKEMKSHQLEGFKFLQSNLLSDTPGGCVLAHAPGSGKTFMIISFLQSFLAQFPNARPLIVLPKGILSTWKKEVQKWQVEDIPLHDLYTAKAENRSQQLDVLKLWVKEKSILFLGFKQLSSIICDSGSNKTTAECQEILLKVPTILILDEGHTSRNDDTDVFQSLAKVQTPRKVVLSGTLYQNHVKEVFNILNLVRPKFLKSKASLDIRKRIMSRVQIGGVRKQVNSNSDSTFFELVEYALQKDDNHSRKVSVITDLREMTHNILHYYKGDFLEELPGLVDFTVFLNLSRRQKAEVPYLQKLDKFKRISEGVAVYLHPNLKSSVGDKSSSYDDTKVDNILKEMELKDGVKLMFFLNLLRLCESAGEKLLVFSQFITPLKLLERFSVMAKGWSLWKQIFVLTGDTNSEDRDLSMDRFNNSPDAKVFFGSIKACGEGISLVGASRVLILDVHLNPSVTRQAIGRAFRPGQMNKVYIYRLVAADSPEEEDHWTSSRKELVSKMWFEWDASCGQQDFEMKRVDVNECGDVFLEDSPLSEDIKVLYKRCF